jgi:hypothetical protein
VLNTAAMSNPFVDKAVEQMENNDNRFVLYYWYATEIYSTFGKGRRIKLPACLKWDI